MEKYLYLPLKFKEKENKIEKRVPGNDETMPRYAVILIFPRKKS